MAHSTRSLCLLVLDVLSFNIHLNFFSGHSRSVDTLYGIEPALRGDFAEKPPDKLKPMTPVADRVANLEAMTLGLMAELNLPLTAVPKLIEYAQVSNS